MTTLAEALAVREATLRERGYNIRPARLSDVPRMATLINGFANQGEMLPRSASELYENIRDFLIIADANDEVAATAALHILWDDLAEIKSVAVSEALHGQGIGAYLVEKCVEEAERMELPTVFRPHPQARLLREAPIRTRRRSQLPPQGLVGMYPLPQVLQLQRDRHEPPRRPSLHRRNPQRR